MNLRSRSRRPRTPKRPLVVLTALLLVLLAACGSREVVIGSGKLAGQGLNGQSGDVGTGGSNDQSLGTSDQGTGGTASGAAVGTATGVQSGGRGSSAGASGSRSGGSSGGGKTDVGVSDTSILVGNTTSQSGAMAGQFDGTPNAAFAYLRSLNEAGGWRGRKFNMQILDDGLDGTRNLSQTKKLVEESKVFALLANATPVQDASTGYLKDKGVPVVGSIPATAGCTDPNEVPCFLSPNRWRGFAEQYLGPRGQKVGSKAALIWIAQQISRDQARGVEAALKATGWQVVTKYEAQLAEPDFTPFVLQARSAGADFVYSVMEVYSNIRLARAMNRQGWNVPFYGLVNYDTNYLSNLGPAADNTYAPGPGPTLFEDSQPGMDKFKATVHKYYPDQSIGPFTFYGWTFARLFVEQGLNKLGADITRPALLNALYQTRNWDGEGLFSPFSVLPKSDPHGGDPPACSSIVKVVSEKFTPLTRNFCGPIVGF